MMIYDRTIIYLILGIFWVIVKNVCRTTDFLSELLKRSYIKRMINVARYLVSDSGQDHIICHLKPHTFSYTKVQNKY